jgi:glucoamylase
VGTAYSASSRVWFTLSHGILNEIYYPTIDCPQVRDAQLLITDGETFLHEERRSLRSRTDTLDPTCLGYWTISEDPEGRYRLIKEVFADPHVSCVLLRVHLEADAQWRERLHVYLLVAPHLGGGGADNSAHRVQAAGHDLLVAGKENTYLAVGADTGLRRGSCGFAGTSDGWQDLHDNYRMDWEFDRAEGGNVAMMGEIRVPEDGRFTVGLAFGDGQHAAITTLVQSLTVPAESSRERFQEQWHRVCCRIRPLDEASGDGGRLYRISHKLLLAHEDKTFAGAFIASASIPWGEAKGDEDLGGYHLVWTRDMVQMATALLACDDLVTPRRALVYLACSQRPDGGFPQNFWLDGRPNWRGIQLDEVAFPILLAWRLWQHQALQELDPYPLVRAAATYLIRQGPVTQQDRWEESSGYSPATLAVTIAALICAADFARDRGEPEVAQFFEEHADFLEAHLEQWTVTTAGSLLPDVPRHYLRIHPVPFNDPRASEDPNAGVLDIPNLPPDAPHLFPARDVVDAGFLELVRYGVRRAGDPLIEDSLRVVDAVLKVDTPLGPCWRRYNHDGYGQRADGKAFLGWGQGRAWPLLTGERAHYERAAGRDPRPLIAALEALASGVGMLPEQVWDEADLPSGRMRLGHPTGSAMPLMWAHAEYIKLLRSVADGQTFDLIPPVAERYQNGRGRQDLEVWKPRRHAQTMRPGMTLRVQAGAPFVLRWSADEWQTTTDTEATTLSIGASFMDLVTTPAQTGALRFTFLWTAESRWEGQDYEVRIVEGG